MSRKLKEILLRNMDLKLLSVVLAVLTFYAIREITSMEAQYEIPVDVKAEKGVAVLDLNPRTVQATFRGSPEDIGRIDQRRVKVVVRPRETALNGSHMLPLAKADVKGTRAVKVVRLNPRTVSVTFDREEEKAAPVAPIRLTGAPAVGRALARCRPAVVSIRGPARRLRDIQSVSVESIDVSDRISSFTTVARVIAPSEWISSVEPAEVAVDVTIAAEPPLPEFKDVPVLVVQSADAGRKVELEPAAVTVSVRPLAETDALREVRRESVRAFVDCAGLAPGEYELPVQVLVAGGGDFAAAARPATVRAVVQGGITGNRSPEQAR